MKIVKLYLAITLLAFFSTASFSQKSEEQGRLHCGTAQINNQRLVENPLIQDIINQQNELRKQFAKNHVSNKSGVISYTIPVVYHVIHNNGSENVSKATIEASINNLNEDYQKLNADISQVVAAFTGITADCEIQFRLAHIDPNGNCTEGITRTQSTLTYSAGENVKSLVNWNTTKYLNVWVVNTLASGAGGYSYYPGWAPSQAAEGIVIRSAQLTNSLTHEVGHYLNLAHCWGSSNDPGLAGNCTSDDGISDTPNTIGNTTCNTSAVSCGSLDNVQNYMEYSFCERMFTEGQKSAMHAALNSSAGARNNLWTAANLAATGTDDPYGPVVCAPIADFNYDKEIICEGASVQFTDNSYNGIPTAWNWTFTGGTPSSSSSQNPTITYNTAGVYSVTHQPSTAGGSGSITKNNIITVSSIVPDFTGPIVEGFENSAMFNTDWTVNNISGSATWQSSTGAAATGSRSASIFNFVATTGDVDELISSSYDISSSISKEIRFKWAFAKRSSANSDRMLVYTSVDCGATWQLRKPITTGNLASAPDHSGPFVPTATEWKEDSIDLTAMGSETHIRFKFRFEAGGGNNIYLDDINIGDWAIGMDELTNIGSFTVYPNPTLSSAKLAFTLTNDVEVLSIKVRNAVGQEVTSVVNGQAFARGRYTLNVDEQRKLSSGIYFIEFKADDQVKVEKLVVQ